MSIGKTYSPSFGLGLPPADDLKSIDVWQGMDGTCAIRSQQLILRDFGINHLKEEYVSEAIERGWYSPGSLFQNEGTPATAIGNLLDLHGVGTSRYCDANMYDIANALAQGRRVIVGVDADELWGNVPLDASDTDHTPNHALIVSGLDFEKGTVILTDTGTGHIAKEYPMAHFDATWNDSGRLMVVTNEPAPNLKDFDYEHGHVNELIEGLPYDEWRERHDGEFHQPFMKGVDADGDGKIDSWFHDTDGDGIPDHMSKDLSNDGNPDILIPIDSEEPSDFDTVGEDANDEGADADVDTEEDLAEAEGPVDDDDDGTTDNDALVEDDLSSDAYDDGADDATTTDAFDLSDVAAVEINIDL